MSSKRALKQSQKLAFQKHKANTKTNKFFSKNYKFSKLSNKKNKK